MNKKQRNRKIVAQNRRNRMINRRYSSTIKTLTKLFNLKMKGYKLEETDSEPASFLLEISPVINNLYSIIDKAVKKNVIHKNTAARKKSNVNRLFQTVNIK
jgi:small subunit ribosomal protein S20